VAIQHARQEYNDCAEKLNPPRSKLSWTQVIETATLSEFNLLRDTRQDIRQLPWAQPARREATNLYFKIKGAHAEIRRLNVEIRRLLSFMLDDHADYYHVIASLIIVNPPLAYELQVKWIYRQKINAGIVRQLVKASELDGFSGQLLPGLCVGREPDRSASVPFPWWIHELVRARGCRSSVISAESGQAHDETDEADVDVDVGHLTDWVANLSV
jgi:hypothetical protein